MRRREFITLLGGAAIAWPLTARAQLKMLHVGGVTGNPESVAGWPAFEQRMAELGWQDGKNFTFDLLRAPTIEAFASGSE